MSYDFADDPIRTTNPLGFITTSVFDKLLRPVASVDPLLNRTTTTFDVAGRRSAPPTRWALARRRCMTRKAGWSHTVDPLLEPKQLCL